MNRTKRLIKSPKLYWGDTGVALHLAGLPEPGATQLVLRQAELSTENAVDQ